jgi:DNA repair protein RadC
MIDPKKGKQMGACNHNGTIPEETKISYLPENPSGADYSLANDIQDESDADGTAASMTRKSIQRAGYQILGTVSIGLGLSDAGHFRSALSHRRTRRCDLWHRFLSLAGTGQTMPDDEFLEMVLYTTGRIKDAKSLAKKLLDRFGSLGGVFNADLYQLAEVGEIDQDMANAFRAVRGVAAHFARLEIAERPVLDNWDKLIVYLRTTMAHRPVEQFRILFLNRMNVLLADEMQQEGTIDHTPLYPREVVKRALIHDASAILMVHNHPSNNAQPSQPDIDTTMQLKRALNAMGIVLHDHVIVSKSGHTSFRLLGLL